MAKLNSKVKCILVTNHWGLPCAGCLNMLSNSTHQHGVGSVDPGLGDKQSEAQNGEFPNGVKCAEQGFEHKSP